MKFDDDDEFCSVRKDTLHVNYAQAAYFSSFTTTHPPHQDPARVMTKKFYDPLQPYFVWFHILLGIFHKEINLRKNLRLSVISTSLGETRWF